MLRAELGECNKRNHTSPGFKTAFACGFAGIFDLRSTSWSACLVWWRASKKHPRRSGDLADFLMGGESSLPRYLGHRWMGQVGHALVPLAKSHTIKPSARQASGKQWDVLFHRCLRLSSNAKKESEVAVARFAGANLSGRGCYRPGLTAQYSGRFSLEAN